MRFKRPKFQPSLAEQLEDRAMLSGTPLDLDLSAVPTQTVFAGETLNFNLSELGASINEGEDGPRSVMYQLDPDGDELPDGVSMNFSGDFQWTPTSEQEGQYRVKIIAVENGQPTSADVESLMIDVRVGRPEVDLNGEDQDGVGFDALFQVGHGPVSVVDGGLSVSDEDGDMIQSAKVELTNPLDGVAESLSIDVEGTNITVEYADGVLILSGEDTAANYANALKTLTYNNTNLDADSTARTVEISVNDGEYDSEVATSTIAINHAPDLQPIGDETVEAGQSNTLTIEATDQNDGDELFLLLDVESPDYVTLTQEPGSRFGVLTIAPDAEVEPGEYEIRVLAVDQYGLADAQSFMLTVTAAAVENTPPTITSLDDLSIPMDGITEPLEFAIGDAETPVEELSVSVESDNTDLVDPTGIILSGEGEARTLVVSPLIGATGQANISLTVSDGEASITESFLLTVTAPNTAPTITPIDDQTIPVDGVTDPLEFVIGDPETPVEELSVSAESDNDALVDPAGIILSGEGETRTLVVTPLSGATGEANVTVTVSDGEASITESFLVTVAAPNMAPTITPIEDQIIDQDSATAPLEFAVGDTETPVEELAVSVESDNAALVDPAGIILSGEGESHVLVVTPLSGATGEANITVSVSDGEETTSMSFLLTVNAVSVDPLALADSFTTDEDSPLEIETGGVLDNDTGEALAVLDVNGDAAQLGTELTLDSGSLLTINADGSLSYNPNGKFEALAEGEAAVDVITYTAIDANDATASGDVEITVTGVNDAPVATDDQYATDSETALTLTLAGVLSNDVDVDNGDVLSVAAVNGEAANVGQPVELATGALLTLNADGSMTFDPNGKFEGLTEAATETFSYTAIDASGLTAEASVLITITAPSGVENQNAPPVNNLPGDQETDSATPIVFSDANGNAISVSDPDAGDAVVEMTITVDQGLLTLVNGYQNDRHKLVGSIEQINTMLNGLVYTPTADFVGTATLSVTTNDLGNTGLGEVRIDADSLLIAVAAVSTGDGEGSGGGENVDVIVNNDDDFADLFDQCWWS